jgi:tripartite-type tricarboxylate transporter receptor subunit TctC
MKLVAALLGAAALCLSHAAVAQTYPTKSVRFLVPFAPGGSSDIIARSLGNHFSAALGQQFVVENKAGGAGNIAMEEVKRAAPDGYTLILGHVGTLAVNPAMFGAKLPYDPVKDFAPITLLALVPNVIAVHPDLPVKTLAELVAYAKANPGKLNYGTAGNGSAGHLAMEYFKLQSKLDIAHIPYRGTGPMLTDLLGGQVQLTFNGIPPILGHIRAGKLRPIAVGAGKRVSSLPDVPTIAESGYPGFETSQWYGLMAPAGTPKPVIDRLQREATIALASGEAQRRITEDGALTAAGTPEAFATLIARERERWGEVVRAAKIQPD